jgi:hypothetical protein
MFRRRRRRPPGERRRCVASPVALFVGVLVSSGCGKAPAAPTMLVDERGPRPFDADVRAGIPAAPVAATFQDTLRLFGARLPARVKAGEVVEGTVWWLVEREPGGRRPKVLVRLATAGVELGGVHGDHNPAVPAVEWRAGDVVVDRVRITVPEAAAGTIDVVVGIAESDWRWRVDVADEGNNDTRPRGFVRLGSVHVEAARPPAAAQVPRVPADAGIVVDGVLDEAAWQTAAVLPLVPYLGKGTLQRPTTALLLWSPEALFLAFRAVDPDPFSPFSHDDDPLYDSEALEIFIDADGDADVYVELQASPTDLRFDAAFAGGRRQGMDVAWSGDHVVKTVRGMVDVDDGRGPQPGFVQEWRIPVASLQDIPAGEPRVGARWRVNLFRLERLRTGDRVTSTEASAWSPPLTGDFHTLTRLGTVEFVDEPNGANDAAGAGGRGRSGATGSSGGGSQRP